MYIGLYKTPNKALSCLVLFCSAEMNLPGYEIFRRDRNNGSLGGGILIPVKDTLLATRQPPLEEDSCEAVWCKTHVAGFRPLYNGCIYRTPDHHPDSVFRLDNSLSKITSSSCIPSVLITGDFNLPHINWDPCDNEHKYHMQDNPQYGPRINQALLDMVNRHPLSQCVKDPTRNCNILDLVFITNPNLIKSTIVNDHDLVITELDLKIM